MTFPQIECVLIDRLDKRKVDKLHLSEHDPYTFGIYKFKKSSAPTDKPSIILEFKRVNRKSESFNRMVMSAASEDMIFEAYTTIVDAIKDHPKVAWQFIDELVEDINGCEDMDPELQKIMDEIEDQDEEDIEAEEYSVEELMKALSSGQLDLEDIFAKPDMNENDRFTAEFMDFCMKTPHNFHRLTLIAPYISLVGTPDRDELQHLNFMAYLSFCSGYDEFRATETDPFPMLLKMASVIRTTKSILDDYAKPRSSASIVQALLGGLQGYQNKEWTEKDFVEFEEFAEELREREEAGKISLHDNADRLRDLRADHAEFLSAIASRCTGDVWTSDLWKYIKSNPFPDAFGEPTELDICIGFIKYCREYLLRSNISIIINK